MAINPENYKHNSFWEIHGIQKVYIEDYSGVKAELAVASEEYRSGQVASIPARRKVEELIRRKLAILEDINALGRILDERDGTIATSVAS